LFLFVKSGKNGILANSDYRQGNRPFRVLILLFLGIKMSRKKILWLDCAPFCGGAQESLCTAINGLLQKYPDDYEGRLWYSDRTADDWGSRLAHLSNLSVRYFPCHHWRRTLFGLCCYAVDYFRTFFKLRHEILTYRPDLIHVNSLRAYLLLPQGVLKHTVVIVHDRDWKKPAGVMQKIAYDHRCPLSVLAVSQKMVLDWQTRFPGVRCFFLPNPIEIPEELQMPEGAHCDEIPRFTMIGDWMSWKNHSLFVQSIAAYQKKYGACYAIIQARLRVKANKEYREKVLHEISKNKLEMVIRVEEGTGCACETLKQMTMLVSCAKNEPFGRTVVEALLCGKPVVSIKGSCGPEEILAGARCGILCEASPKAIADAMDEMTQRLQREPLSLNAQKIGLRYAPDQLAQKLKCYYDYFMKK